MKNDSFKLNRLTIGILFIIERPKKLLLYLVFQPPTARPIVIPRTIKE